MKKYVAPELKKVVLDGADIFTASDEISLEWNNSWTNLNEWGEKQ